MKKYSVYVLVALIAFLCACSGSDTYRGAWKAMDASGAKFEINFDTKNFTVKDSTGKSSQFDYTQNSVEIQNSVETYGIQLGDGRNYRIKFPKPADESVGLINDENGIPVYTISRNAYIKYEELYNLR